jgi:hypothetical protein
MDHQVHSGLVHQMLYEKYTHILVAVNLAVDQRRLFDLAFEVLSLHQIRNLIIILLSFLLLAALLLL